jgi:hypothetical protein
MFNRGADSAEGPWSIGADFIIGTPFSRTVPGR